ncbi:MAG: hypothetical protein KBI44_18660 [Thermoanaerobaculia bacterium]|nr:hypothetical protein [Thermoanaerobaculia bacterium]
MSFLERHPALKKAVANQYQAILAAGAIGFSALTLSPLPLLLWAGVQMMTLPFLVERLKRRLEIEKKYAAREAVEMSQDQQLAALPAAARGRLQRLQQLCERIQANYKGLSPASQGVMADQAAKFDAVLASFLRRLWLLQKYDEMAFASDDSRQRQEIERLERQLATAELAPRVREALEKHLEIQRQLVQAVEKNAQNSAALAAELDSLEALLHLLLQKSVAATDALAFSAEIDDVLAQVEADHASVEEMERMLGSLPQIDVGEPLAPRLRLPGGRDSGKTVVPPPPPAERSRTRR